MKNTHSSSKRLESLDALRGFDLFFLVALGPLMHSLARTANVEWLNESMWVFSHVSWEGFSPWDLIMPLFLFMSGISMPFSLSRYKSISDKRPLLRRLAKRILLLWIFGMMCQGNLLALDPNTIYLYSNTLKAIATGYLITALLFLFTSRRTQIITAVVLLLVYWTAMQFITVDGYGGGNYTPQGNLAEWIDNTVLGRFRDTAQVIDGKVVVADWYHYTWILSSLNFGVTVLTGLFAGYIAKDKIEEKPVFHGCPGTRMKIMDHKAEEVATEQTATVSSQLSQWPVQIKLVPVNAPYFKDANLLIAADCTAYAYGNFHQKFIKNKVTLIGCPKLDEGDYSEKLTQIIANNDIKSVTIVRMEVPCCGGLENAAKKAIQDSGKFLPWQVHTISIDGKILEA